MSVRIIDLEQQSAKRRLRRRIARLRRRIDRRVLATRHQTRRLGSWKTYVTSFPGSTMIGAFGVGLALSAGLGGRRLSRRIGWRLVRRAVDWAAVDWASERFWRDLAGIWADSTPEKSAGAEHD